MKKPSLKSKLTADKIEEANRLLSEQIKASNQSMEISPVSEGVIKPSNSESIEVSEKVVEKVPKTSPQAEAKPKTKATYKQTAVREPKEIKYVRVTIDVPEDLHEKLKIKMILSKQTIKDYLLSFIEKDLGKIDYKF